MKMNERRLSYKWTSVSQAAYRNSTVDDTWASPHTATGTVNYYSFYIRARTFNQPSG